MREGPRASNIDDLEPGEIVRVAPDAFSNHKGWLGVVIDAQTYGKGGIYEAVQVEFEDPEYSFESLPPGALIRTGEHRSVHISEAYTRAWKGIMEFGRPYINAWTVGVDPTEATAPARARTRTYDPDRVIVI